MIKSNLSSSTLSPFSPKKSPGKRFWVTDNYLQLYLHITNSDNTSTIKFISYSSLVYFSPRVKVSEEASVQVTISLSKQEPHLSAYTTPFFGMDPVTRHAASAHLQNWCLHQLTFIYDYQILYNVFLYLMTASL